MVGSMFGFGTSIGTVFASRWKAVTWSLGIMMLAYCTVPSEEQTDREAAAAHAKADQKSPWSKD